MFATEKDLGRRTWGQLEHKEITPVDLKCFKEVLATNHEPLIHSCAGAVIVTGLLGVKRYTKLIYTRLKASVLHLGVSKPEKGRKSGSKSKKMVPLLQKTSQF